MLHANCRLTSENTVTGLKMDRQKKKKKEQGCLFFTQRQAISCPCIWIE